MVAIRKLVYSVVSDIFFACPIFLVAKIWVKFVVPPLGGAAPSTPHSRPNHSATDKYLTKSFQIVFCDNKNDSVNKYQEKFITYSEPIPLSIFSTSSTRLSNEVYAEKGSHKYLIKRQRISTGLSSGE